MVLSTNQAGPRPLTNRQVQAPSPERLYFKNHVPATNYSAIKATRKYSNQPGPLHFPWHSKSLEAQLLVFRSESGQLVATQATLDSIPTDFPPVCSLLSLTLNPPIITPHLPLRYCSLPPGASAYAGPGLDGDPHVASQVRWYGGWRSIPHRCLIMLLLFLLESHHVLLASALPSARASGVNPLPGARLGSRCPFCLLAPTAPHTSIGTVGGSRSHHCYSIRMLLC
jgi:hypothetical protein